jgi:hypothetical protein
MDDDGRGPGDPQWFGEAFDIPANLAALAAARDFGRRSVEDFADRFLPPASPDATGDGAAGGAAAGTRAEREALLAELRADLVRAGEAGADLLTHAFALLSLAVDRRPDRSPGAEPLALSVAAGDSAVAVFWVHNASPVPVPSVRPHCGALRSHTGAELAPETLQFDPPALEPMPGRSSVGIEVRAAPPAGTAPGTYLSLLLATGVPGLHLPVAVTVTGAPRP